MRQQGLVCVLAVSLVCFVEANVEPETFDNYTCYKNMNPFGPLVQAKMSETNRSACATLCTANGECKYFLWNDLEDCYLKKDLADTEKVEYDNPDYGTVACFNESLDLGSLDDHGCYEISILNSTWCILTTTPPPAVSAIQASSTTPPPAVSAIQASSELTSGVSREGQLASCLSLLSLLVGTLLSTGIV